MAAPIEWLSEFQVNTGSVATGTQSNPKIVGLGNGNFVVVWEEASSGTVGADASADIVAKIYDAEGNVARDSFQLNSSFFADDERDFDLTATHDGFAIAFVDDDIVSTNQTTISYERFDFGGTRNQALSIVTENIAADFVRNPQLVSNLIASNDDVFIAYDDDVGVNTDINARIIDQADVLGAEFDAGQNSADFDRLGDFRALTGSGVLAV